MVKVSPLVFETTHPSLLFGEVVWGVHPIERFVGSAVGVDGHTSVGLHHHETGCLRKVGRQLALIVDRAFRHPNPHGH